MDKTTTQGRRCRRVMREGCIRVFQQQVRYAMNRMHDERYCRSVPSVLGTGMALRREGMLNKCAASGHTMSKSPRQRGA